MVNRDKNVRANFRDNRVLDIEKDAVKYITKSNIVFSVICKQKYSNNFCIGLNFERSWQL